MQIVLISKSKLLKPFRYKILYMTILKYLTLLSIPFYSKTYQIFLGGTKSKQLYSDLPARYPEFSGE